MEKLKCDRCKGTGTITLTAGGFQSEVPCASCLGGQALSTHDPVNHPKHYTGHPSGIECIQVTEHLNFCIGNAVKYIWRAGDKGNIIEDLSKARWYLDREIERLKKGME